MRITVGFPFLAAVCICSLGWAQEKREERKEVREERREVRREEPGPLAVRREANARIVAGSADQQIAAFLHGCARNEVEISKFAAGKAASEEVKEFAAMMVKEHTPCLEKLHQAAGSLASSHAPGTPGAAVKKVEFTEEIKEEKVEKSRRDPATKDSPAAAPREGRSKATEPRTRAVTEERTTTSAQVAGSQGLDWTLVHKQLADQCLATTKAELQKKEGAEFDQCYIGQQIMAHMMMIDHCKVLRTHASVEMRKELDEASEICVQHLEHAKKLAESMKSEAGEKASKKSKDE